MFNLNEILQNAQGGQAVNNLASQFGISPEQAQAAVTALIPALSSGFKSTLSQPGALSGVIGSLGEPQHNASFNDPQAAQSDGAAEKGGDVLSQIFGSSDITNRIAQRAAAATGLPPELLARMLPVIASMVMGGLMASLHNQGFGGLFGQLANAAQQGGLGSILGQLTGAGPAAQPGQAAPSGGGLGGLVGSVLGSVFGGHGTTTPGTPASMPQFNPQTIQAGMDALTKMLRPGVQSPVAQSLEDEVGQILGGKR